MTTLPPLVGLIGKKRVGKDTFAATLVEEFGFARVAFADPLKDMALTIDPIIQPGDEFRLAEGLRELVEDEGWEVVKDAHPEARRFLQRLGDGVRQFDPEFWLRAGMARADDMRAGLGATPSGDWDPEFRPVVITDVRYPNEAAAIRVAGGILVRIVRPGVDDGDTHASETALDDYDADLTVNNAGSLVWFQDQARRAGAGSWAPDWPAH